MIRSWFGKDLKLVFKFVISMLCLSVASQKGFAQYYPYPTPISAVKEAALLHDLQNGPNNEKKLNTLLNLSNLYYNKIIKQSTNLNLSLDYAKRAKQLSISLKNLGSYNNAQLQIAYALIEMDNYKGAEQVLPTLNDTTKEKLLLTLGFKYYNRYSGQETTNYDSAAVFVQQATVLSAKLNHRLNHITCLKYTGMIHAVQGNLPLAEKELLSALAQYRQIGYRKLQYPYIELALMYSYKGEYDKALANSLQSLHYMKQTKDSTSSGDVYLVLSRILKHDSQKQKALDYAKLAFKAYQQLFGYGYTTLAWTISDVTIDLLSLYKYDEALSFILKYSQQYPPNNPAERAIYVGRIGDCYLKLKEYNKAEQYFIDEFNILKSTNSLNVDAYNRIGYFYVECKKYSKAKPYLLEAKKNEKMISMGNKNHLHYMLFLVDSAAADYVSAIKNLSLTKRYDDTMYKQRKVEDIQRLMIQFDTQNKDDQIKLLEQKSSLEAENLKQANKVKNLTVAGILIILIAGLLFYRQYTQKQRTSTLIAVKNRQLEKLLIEKEWLLKEVHHRVKNNLHTIISLLEIQASYLKDDALKAIETSQHRIYAMSLLHQKLYLSDNLKTIDMASYLPELITYLKDGFELNEDILFDLNIDPLQLDVAQAMPIGLIINEAVTNSMKHAFHGKHEKIITLQMLKSGEEVTLKITDNGIGFTLEKEQAKFGSLGLKLIRGLSEDINAKIDIENNNGTQITIKFLPIILNATNTLPDSGYKSEVKNES